LRAEVSEAEFSKRAAKPVDLSRFHSGVGRELFGVFRQNALGAEEGAVVWDAKEAGNS
jgi:phosphogluconate dehydratase